MVSDRVHIKENECFINLDPDNPFNEGTDIPEECVYIIEEIRGEYLRFISRFSFLTKNDTKVTCRIDDFLLDYNHSSHFDNFEDIVERYRKRVESQLEKSDIIQRRMLF